MLCIVHRLCKIEELIKLSTRVSGIVQNFGGIG